MAAALPSATFSGSRLVRRLSELAGKPGTATRDKAGGRVAQQTFAERLGLWLDWTDAIALSAALNVTPAPKPAAPDANSDAAALHLQRAAVAACARVHRDLVKLATADVAFAADKAGAPRLSPAAAATAPDASDFSPHRRDYLAHQRAMENSLGPLRVNLRAALASHSAALARIAALDAVMDEALRVRERHLLATVPQWLEKHFAYLDQTQAADEDRLSRYQQDMQSVLLAELDMRWQPIEGMMEALRHAATQQS